MKTLRVATRVIIVNLTVELAQHSFSRNAVYGTLAKGRNDWSVFLGSVTPDSIALDISFTAAGAFRRLQTGDVFVLLYRLIFGSVYGGTSTSKETEVQ